MVLDLNGVLIHRGVYVAGREHSVHLRPGCTAFLDWLSSRAVLSFWSSITDRSIHRVVDAVLQFTSLKQEVVEVLSQRHCTLSSYVDASDLEKPIFLKNLKVYAKMLGLETVEDVLLVDNGPEKNLLNNVHSAIHPSTWSGDDEDRFITIQLHPWLKGLFRSRIPIIQYVKLVLLPSGQLPIYRKSELAIKILRRVTL